MDQKSSGIHPAPSEFSNAQLAENPILQFFHYKHLPAQIQETSYRFFDLARDLIGTLPRNAERTVALRKLLEAKDAAVRANLPPAGFTRGQNTSRSVASERVIGEPQETGGHDEDRDGPIPFGD